MTKLFVGGLAYSINSQQLNEIFSKFGQVSSAQVIVDRDTNQSKGFAFVEMANDDEAQAAIQALNETELEGRKVGVSVARPSEPRSGGGGGGGFNRDRNSGGGGRGGGGFGGGRDSRGGGGGRNRY